MVEIGPRMELELVRVFDGVLGGKIIYRNKGFKNASDIRKEKNKKIIK